MSLRLSIAVFFAFFSAVALAADALPEGIAARLAAVMPGESPDSVREMPVAGLYEIRFGAAIIYISADGRYLIQGRIMDFETNRNLTEEAQLVGRRAILDGLKESDLVVYSPKDPKHTITVFTDIDCGYCRKFHQEMADLNRLGIRVRYAAYPRAGEGSESWQKAVNVWCAKERNAAMDESKAGRNIEKKACDNPVTAQLELGGQLGVSGTPTIFLEGGESIPGYRPAADLAAIVAQAAEARNAQGQ